MSEEEDSLIRAAAALAVKLIDELANSAIEKEETATALDNLKDVLDIIHDSKQRKAGLR